MTLIRVRNASRLKHYGGSYQIVPVSTTKGCVTGTHVLEAELDVEANKVLVSEESHAIGDLGILDSLNVGFHEDCPQTHVLVLPCNGKRMDTDGTAPLLVTLGLLFLRSRQRGFALSPICRESHTGIGDAGCWTSCSYDVGD